MMRDFYQAGISAYFRGAPLYANPAGNDIERRDWLAGYGDAKAGKVTEADGESRGQRWTGRTNPMAGRSRDSIFGMGRGRTNIPKHLARRTLRASE